MNDLKTSLEDLIDDSRLPGPPSIEELRERSRRRNHRVLPPSRLLIMTAVVVLAGAVIVLVNVPNSRTNGTNHHVVNPPRVPNVIGIGPGITQPDVLAANNGKIWVTGISPDYHASSSLREFDEDTGKILSTIGLPDDWPGEIAVGSNAIWLRTQQNEESTHLLKIDATTHKILLIVTLQKDGGLAVTQDAVWTVNGSLGLLRIDPRTGRIVATIRLPGGPYAPLILMSGPAGVFLGSPYDGSILRVNQQTNTVSLVTHIGDRIDEMEELGTSLWVSTGSALVQVPLSPHAIGRTIQLGAPILSLASDGHSLWALTGKPRLGSVRIDPASGQVSRVDLPAKVEDLFAVVSDPTTGSTWATASSPNPSLLRLLP